MNLFPSSRFLAVSRKRSSMSINSRRMRQKLAGRDLTSIVSGEKSSIGEKVCDANDRESSCFIGKGKTDTKDEARDEVDTISRARRTKRG